MEIGVDIALGAWYTKLCENKVGRFRLPHLFARASGVNMDASPLPFRSVGFPVARIPFEKVSIFYVLELEVRQS